MSRDADNSIFVAEVQKWLGVDPDGWAGQATLSAWLEKTGHAPVKPPAGKPLTQPSLDARSEGRLKGVDSKLANVVRKAKTLSTVPFTVVEGLRSAARQAELYAQGRTKPGKVVTWTMKSKHIEGRAVDLAPYENGKIDWNDLSKFDAIARAMKQAAQELGVPIRHGGNWDGDDKPREKGETDNPHFELL